MIDYNKRRLLDSAARHDQGDKVFVLLAIFFAMLSAQSSGFWPGVTGLAAGLFASLSVVRSSEQKARDLYIRNRITEVSLGQE